MLAGILYLLDVPMIVQSLGLSLSVFVAFGTVAGLMFGGLAALRPDHDAYIGSVHDAQRAGRYSVIVHAFNPQELADSSVELRVRGGEITSTL